MFCLSSTLHERISHTKIKFVNRNASASGGEASVEWCAVKPKCETSVCSQTTDRPSNHDKHASWCDPKHHDMQSVKAQHLDYVTPIENHIRNPQSGTIGRICHIQSFSVRRQRFRFKFFFLFLLLTHTRTHLFECAHLITTFILTSMHLNRHVLWGPNPTFQQYCLQFIGSALVR